MTLHGSTPNLPLTATPSQDPAIAPSWQFEISDRPLSQQEQSRFQADLSERGLDGTVWEILNGSLVPRTADSRPKLLRAYQDGQLLGVAYFVECQRICKYLLPQVWLGNLLDLMPIPMFFWVRYGSLIDAITNPGFVADGMSRESFFQAAIAHLQQVYLYGTVLDKAGLQPVAAEIAGRFPFCDTGIIHLEGTDPVAAWLKQHKNLKRKLNRFRNRQGRIEVLRGALPQQMAAIAQRILNNLHPLIMAPFQDNYTPMAMQACGLDSPNLVHIVAYLEEQMVGYQSFVICGKVLYCLSGAFDRNYTSTYHAYENIILSSIQFACEAGLARIEYGPILNPTKAVMMSHFRPCEQLYYSRWRALHPLLRRLIPLTRLAPNTFEPYRNLPSIQNPAS